MEVFLCPIGTSDWISFGSPETEDFLISSDMNTPDALQVMQLA